MLNPRLTLESRLGRICLPEILRFPEINVEIRRSHTMYVHTYLGMYVHTSIYEHTYVHCVHRLVEE